MPFGRKRAWLRCAAIERGYTSWIGSFVSHARPLGFCTGTVVGAPLRTAPSDTLFVMYGGIPKGAIC